MGPVFNILRGGKRFSHATCLTYFFIGMDRGRVASAMAAGLVSKASSKPVNHTILQLLRDAVSFSFPNKEKTVDGEKTSHPVMTKTMLRMACKVMEMTEVA